MIAGDAETCRELLARQRALLAEVPYGLGRWQLALQDFVLASLAGELEEADRLADVALEIGTASGQLDAVLVATVQHDGLSEWRDAEGGNPAAMRALADEYDDAAGRGIWRGALIRRLTQRGELDEARSRLREAHAEGLGYLEWTLVSAAYWTSLAEAAVALRDLDIAAEVYRGLLPHRGQHIYPSAGSYGSADRFLGRLATVVGRLSVAAEHLAVADAMHARLGAPLFHALTLAARAEWLGAQDPSDPAIARLADEAVGLAREHRALGVERDVRATIDRIGTRT
jgi:hypothetical protein